MPNDSQNDPHAAPNVEFLARAEQLRLKRECFCTLDLRQLSAEFCRRYVYRGRSMWLDEASRKHFQAGLKQHAGVFTVATYEQILSSIENPPGSAPLDAHNGPPGEYDKRGRPRALSAIFSSTQWRPQQAAVPSSVFELGYFEKRAHKRIKHALPVLLLVDGRVIPAETRDISYNGLQIRTKVPLQATQGSQVRIRVSPVMDPGQSGEAAYRVVRVASLLSDTMLALDCIETGSNRTLEYLRQIIQSKPSSSSDQGKKLDAQDALLTSYSLLAERFYMRSTSVIPFFLFHVDDHKTPIRLIFSNPNNVQALRAFEGPDDYDFSVLVGRRFLKLLTTLVHRESQADTLLAVHQPYPGARLVAKANDECRKGNAWYRHLATHMQASRFFVFKVVARRVRRPISFRVLSDIDSLTSQSTDLAEKLLREAEKLIIAGALVDVTAQIREWDLGRYRNEAPPADSARAPPPRVPGSAPEVRPISYFEENRREPRFVSQLAAECEAAGVRFNCKARDISAHGLSLVCDAPPSLHPGDRLRVSFPRIKAGSRALNLSRIAYRDIPFEVVAVDAEGPFILRLKQVDGWHSRLFASAFRKYLEKRKSPPPLELSHLVRSAASRFYSSVFIESSATIPVFIFERPRSKQKYALKAGVTQSPSYLAGFFEVADGEFDFQAFAEGQRLEKLLQQVRDQGRAETALMLRKEKIRGVARYRIKSINIGDSQAASGFTNRPPGENFCCVKLVACKPQTPPSVEVEQAITRLQNFSKPKTDELKAEFTNLVAIGDLVEITGQLVALQPTPAADH